MARYKHIDSSPRFLAVDLRRQLLPGTFEHAPNHLLEHEIDLSGFDARFKNDLVGAAAYPPALSVKVVLFAYAQGIVSSRGIAAACREHVTFIALCGDNAPHFTTIANFGSALGDEVAHVFGAVLAICDRDGLLGREMFAIDGVKLPSNAAKQRSGTRTEFARRALRKSNRTDNDSAKMATGKGVIQGYTGVAVVDAKEQIIVCAQAHGTGSEQEVLLPVVEEIQPLLAKDSLLTADAGYHSGAKRVCGPCPIRTQCLRHPDRTAVRQVVFFTSKLRKPESHSARMKRRIDSPEGRIRYGQRFATVEPVFGNLRYNKGLDRFTLRGKSKVDGQWKPFCLVHKVEKLAHHGYAQ
jgi:transposase